MGRSALAIAGVALLALGLLGVSGHLSPLSVSGGAGGPVGAVFYYNFTQPTFALSVQDRSHIPAPGSCPNPSAPTTCVVNDTFVNVTFNFGDLSVYHGTHLGFSVNHTYSSFVGSDTLDELVIWWACQRTAPSPTVTCGIQSSEANGFVQEPNPCTSNCTSVPLAPKPHPEPNAATGLLLGAGIGLLFVAATSIDYVVRIALALLFSGIGFFVGLFNGGWGPL